MTSDQKRALGIGALGIGGFLLWRRHSATSSRAPTLTSAYSSGASGSLQPYTPQDPITVAPGESIYDPNTEALLNTPTSPVIDTGGSVFGPGGEQNLGQSTSPAAPGYQINVRYPKHHSRRSNHKKTAKRKVKTKK